MKIIFYGDSLTVGRPGVGFVERLAWPEVRRVQYAWGGATVRSLQQAVFKRRLMEPNEITVVWVGVHDVLPHLSWSQEISHQLRRQEWALGGRDIHRRYRSLLESLEPYADHLIAMSPLFVGEGDNPWNERLAEYAAEMRAACEDFAKITYLDLRTPAREARRGMSISAYMPRRAGRVLLDALLLRTPAAVDRVSARRGLHFTLDGVHLNSRGAQFVADHLTAAIAALPITPKPAPWRRG